MPTLRTRLVHRRGVTTRVLIASASATLLMAPGAARADVTHASFDGPEDFLYHVDFMPDLDQKRTFLPANGSMFCVPTSTMNMFAYAAEWGFKDLEPGPGVWISDVPYGTLTGRLFDLGALMNTGTTGTGPNGWLNGAGEWIDGFPLVRTAWYRTENWCPTLTEVGQVAASGSLVSICYGRFNFNPGPIPVVGSYQSGHCVTVIHAAADGDDLELWVRDPAADGGDSFNAQSPWSTVTYDVEPRTIWQDWDDDSAFSQLDVTLLNYDPDATLIRMITKIYALRPAFGYSFTTVQLNSQLLTNFDLAVEQEPLQLDLPPSVELADVALNSNLSGYLAILQGAPNDPAALVSIDDRAGAQPKELLEIPFAREIVVGRNRDLYVATLNGTLHRLRYAAGAWSIIASFEWDRPIQDLAYDDANDHVIALSSVDRMLLIAPPSLGSEVEPVFEYELPQEIPAAADACMAVHPTDGGIWIVLEGPGLTVHRVEPAGKNELLYQALVSIFLAGPTCVDFDDRGHMVVSRSTGAVVEFEPNENGGWSAIFDGLYADVVAQDGFRVARSRSNFDPELHAEDEEYVPAEELPEIGERSVDCPGDLTNDGTVDGADVGLLLGIWGGTGPADLDGNGVVDGADLGAMLSTWGPCN